MVPRGSEDVFIVFKKFGIEFKLNLYFSKRKSFSFKIEDKMNEKSYEFYTSKMSTNFVVDRILIDLYWK